MDIVFALLPAAIGLALLGVAGYVWAVKSGQYDDLDTPPLRILGDDGNVGRSKGESRMQDTK